MVPWYWVSSRRGSTQPEKYRRTHTHTLPKPMIIQTMFLTPFTCNHSVTVPHLTSSKTLASPFLPLHYSSPVRFITCLGSLQISFILNKTSSPNSRLAHSGTDIGEHEVRDHQSDLSAVIRLHFLGRHDLHAQIPKQVRLLHTVHRNKCVMPQICLQFNVNPSMQ